MSGNNNFPDYITFARSFEKYKWYKPILVFILGLIVYFILQVLVVAIFASVYGMNDIVSLMMGGYESMNSNLGNYISFLSVAIFLPSLYIASKIVRDRPFSSYSSSRGGWNWKMYFKCLSVPLVIYVIFESIYGLVNGQVGSNTFTLTFFIICLFLVPMQCIAEEYVLRGLFMQTFGSWFNIPVVALILQAVIFAALHPYSILGVIGIFIDGLIFGFLAWKTNGLEAGSALHSINNLSATFVVALGFDVSTSIITPINFVEGVVITAFSAFALYYIGNKYGWFSEKTN